MTANILNDMHPFVGDPPILRKQPSSKPCKASSEESEEETFKKPVLSRTHSQSSLDTTSTSSLSSSVHSAQNSVKSIRGSSNLKSSVHDHGLDSSSLSAGDMSSPKRAYDSNENLLIATHYIIDNTPSTLPRVQKRIRRASPSSHHIERDLDLDRDRSQPKRIRRRSFIHHYHHNKRKTWWLISADNRFKVTWDILTALLSICSIFYANRAIQTRSYEQSVFDMFSEFWFFLDICLNFVTEHKTLTGDIIDDGKAVWARYLTSWFPIDALSLIPWERIFVKPIVDMQKKRGFFKKNFFRTKAIVRVARKLRGGHFKLFGRVANTSKHAGVGGRKLLTYIIRYVPKYVLFYKNMKGVLAVRLLRQIHWIIKVQKTSWVSTNKITPEDSDDNLNSETLPEKSNYSNFERNEFHDTILKKIKDMKPLLHRPNRSKSAPADDSNLYLRHPSSLLSSNSLSYDEYDDLDFDDIDEDETSRRPIIESKRFDDEEDFGLGVY